jgi:NAD(P)H dehydrogenase (quinone)
MQGVSPCLLNGYRRYLEDHRRGAFELGGGANDVVLDVTGRPAEDSETPARRYADLPFARPTTANRLRALANFLRAPFDPRYDLDRFDRDQAHPVPPTARLAIDDERWKLERAPDRARLAAAQGA